MVSSLYCIKTSGSHEVDVTQVYCPRLQTVSHDLVRKSDDSVEIVKIHHIIMVGTRIAVIRVPGQV